MDAPGSLSSTILPQLEELAALIRTVEVVAAATESWTQARNLRHLADALGEVLDASTMLPGALEAASGCCPIRRNRREAP